VRLFAAAAGAHIEDVDVVGADINKQLVATGAELHVGDKWLLEEATLSEDEMCLIYISYIEKFLKL
jgi:hypothetical protein